MPGPNAPYTQLDPGQVLRQAFDEANDRLRVETAATIVAGAVSVSTDAATDSMKIGDGNGHFMAVDANSNAHVVNMAAFVTVPFDTITVTYPLTTQEVYLYKTGGVGGTTVATLTVNYVDATKNQLLNVAKT